MIDQRIGKIKVRRGIDTQRKLVTFEEGELVYSIDKKRLYVGNSKEKGGILVSNRNYVKNSVGNPPVAPPEVLHGDIVYDKSNSKTYITKFNGTANELILIADAGCSGVLQVQINDLTNRISLIEDCASKIPPPVIPTKLTWHTEPSSISVNLGETATFTASAIGGVGVINYKWNRKDGVPISVINNQPTLTLATQLSDDATYYCVANTFSESITSKNAVLTILANSILAEVGTDVLSELNDFIDWEDSGLKAPTITTQPRSQVTTTLVPVTFEVTATGSEPLSYQWRINGVNVAGETNRTYTVTNPTKDLTGITCVVSNIVDKVISNSVNLTVGIIPTITTQPVSQTVFSESSVTFSVVAAGSDPLSYQWSKDGVVITGATSITYTINSVAESDFASYVCLVSNSYGNVTSSAAKLSKIELLSRSWISVAMSSDGTKQTAVDYDGQIYISSDSGDTWTAKESKRNWRSVAMSSDGTKQTAVVGIGQIYISTDSGNTWTPKDSNRFWKSVAMSSDGTKQTAVVSYGQIYISTDSGNTWTAKESDRYWYSVAMSSDGTKQTAVVRDGQIYISTDSGNTWTAKESNRRWYSVAMSSDGTKQTAVDNDGHIYISSDSGNTWTAKESNRSWYSVAMSSDGTKQTAVNGVQIYISTDSGNTWTAKASITYWWAIAMSSDGTKQTAVVYNGKIYVSTDSGNTWTAKF